MKERGQSLTELAMMLPVFLLMLLGVIEIGNAIGNYIELVGTSREIARFAVRGDIVTPYGENKGFDKVEGHYHAISDYPDDKIRMYVHYTEVFVGRPCVSRPCVSICSSINDPDRADDYVMHPGLDPELVFDLGQLPKQSRVDYISLTSELLQEELIQQCMKEKRPFSTWYPETHSQVIVEIFYDMDQLLGFPLFSFVNPIPMYARSTFRWNR